MLVYSFNPARGRKISEFKDSLVYKASSRPIRDTMTSYHKQTITTTNMAQELGFAPFLSLSLEEKLR